MPGVKRASPVDRARLDELLSPWLGDASSDPDLPIPAMIDVDLTCRARQSAARVAAGGARGRADRAGRSAIALAVAGRDFMRTSPGCAAALVLLMAAATAAVVLLAARAGLDTHRDTIEMLHMLGSTDVQVARLFQRRIALDTLFGGAIGTVAAIGVVWADRRAVAALGSDLRRRRRCWRARLAVARCCCRCSFALLATLAARIAVLGALRRML